MGMRKGVFENFWVNSSREWHDKAKFEINSGQATQKVKDYCVVKPYMGELIYNNYCTVKKIIKDSYFRNNKEKKLSRYKRAAVIAQVILLANPLEYKNQFQAKLDPYFLKQRLAFYVALDSIVQDYPKADVENLGGPLYFFSELDPDHSEEDDDFLMSVYKDMFFSEQYNNYNVLTMANVFGLLTERVSELKKIKPNKKANENANKNANEI